MDWIELQKQHQKEEGWRLAMLCVLLLGAAAIDFYVRIREPVWCVVNYDSISLAVIQIQATIQTLSIALLALVSSHASDSIFSVPVIDFQFQIAPVFFSQKWLIKGGLILLVVNVFFHIAGFFNLVMAVFLVACCLIWISTSQIYAAFSGKGAPEQEVEAYLLYAVGKHVAVPQRLNTFAVFCDDWVRSCESQSNALFYSYRELFGKMMDTLVLEENEQARTVLQQKSAEVIHALSFSSSSNVRWRAFSFLSFCYERLWKCISNHKDEVTKLKGGVHILDEAHQDIMELLRDAPIVDIEKQMSWTNLIEEAVGCCFWLGYEAENNTELLSVGDFATYIGWKLAMSPEKSDAECGLLKYWSHSSGLFPEGRWGDGILVLAQVKLRFAIQLIRGGALGILGKNFYRYALYCRSRINEFPDALLVLEIHGYLYYISEWESMEYVSQDLKLACRAFLESEETRRLFRGALDRIARLNYEYARDGREKIFSESLIDMVTNHMRCYEFFPREGMVKAMCLDSALEMFLVFCAICLSGEYDPFGVVRDIVDGKYAVSFYQRYILQPEVRDRFVRFLELVESKQNNIRHTADCLLERFAIVLREKIHDNALQEAAAAQSNYEQNVDEVQIKEQQKAEILENLRGAFLPLLSDEAKDGPKLRIPLLNLQDITGLELEEDIRHFYRELPTNFVEWLCRWAKENSIVGLKAKNPDISDDDALMTFLAWDVYPLVLGTDLGCFARDWHNRERIREILSEKTYISEGPYGWAMLLKAGSLRLYFHEVEVEIASYDISSFNLHQEPQSGEYQYEVMGIPISFTEEELRQYLHDYYKNLRINLVCSVQQDSGQLGYLLVDQL